MTPPRLHPNGTPSAMLTRQLNAAWEALDRAYVALKATAPNPRDHDPETFEAATREHRARLAKLDEVIDEVQRLIVACYS